MYVPSHFEESDRAVLHALIRAHPLGTWVTVSADGPTAEHIPFLLDTARGVHGTLLGHVARANGVWRTLSQQAASLVVFQGAESYVTPSWYPSKQAHGRVVPTWNYAVVHAHGAARAIDDREWLLSLVSRLTDTHEAGRPAPWQVGDAPADYIDKLLQQIVGIEIPLDRLTGKWKVSQNRPLEDRAGVASGLRAARLTSMAELVEQHNPKQSER